MLSYGLFSCFVLLIANLDIVIEKNKKLLKYLLIFTVVIFIGFRYELGVDWLFYRDYYHGKSITLTIEPGYQLLSLLMSSLGINFWLFVSLITLSISLVLARFFERYSPFPIFCLSLYFIISFGFNIEALRQIIAVTLFFISLNYYLNQNVKAFYGWCVAACFFHISAILLLALPFINDVFFRKIAKIIILVGLLLAAVGIYPVEVALQLLNFLIHNAYIDKLMWYSAQENSGSIFTFNLMFKFTVVFFYFYKKKAICRELNSRGVSEKFCSCLEVLVLTMLLIDVFLGRYGTITSRLDEYFTPVFIIDISLIVMVNRLPINRLIFSSLFSLYLLVSFIRFSENEYFEAQYLPYNNFISSQFNNSNTSKREAAVMQHWISKKD